MTDQRSPLRFVPAIIAGPLAWVSYSLLASVVYFFARSAYMNVYRNIDNLIFSSANIPWLHTIFLTLCVFLISIPGALTVGLGYYRFTQSGRTVGFALLLYELAFVGPYLLYLYFLGFALH